MEADMKTESLNDKALAAALKAYHQRGASQSEPEWLRSVISAYNNVMRHGEPTQEQELLERVAKAIYERPTTLQTSGKYWEDGKHTRRGTQAFSDAKAAIAAMRQQFICD